MQWNKRSTADYGAMMAETITITGHEGKPIKAYYSHPVGQGPYASIVLIPHMPGWDEWVRECARRFTDHGYAVVAPNIYEDFGDGIPTDVSAKVREKGGCKDSNVMADTQASINYLRALPDSNGKVGVIGMCSGGRHTFLAACTCEGIDAAVDCWGGGVATPFPFAATEEKPVLPIELAENISCPILGIFGNDDHSPAPEEVDRTEQVLKDLGKDYTFYRYDGAGHGIWYYDKPMFRQEQALDSFNKVMDFFDEKLYGAPPAAE